VQARRLRSAAWWWMAAAVALALTEAMWPTPLVPVAGLACCWMAVRAGRG
jgi:hypothetical protein